MTTTSERTNLQLFTNRRRARALRWLLKLATANDLPMPRNVEFGEMTAVSSGQTLRFLTLGLDEGSDVTGWAKAINAEDIEEFDVTGDTHTWTCVRAFTAWRDGPRVDWHHIEVTTRYGYRPLHPGRRP
jgi:hypothetical protein